MSDWTHLETVDVDSVNTDLVSSVPTADVGIYYPSNLDPAHTTKVTVDLLVHGFERAKAVFAVAGVQLRLKWFRTGYLKPSLFAVHSTRPGSEIPGGRFQNLYVEAERHPAECSSQALEAFEATVGEVPNGDRMIHLVVLQDVFMDFYEPLDFRTWQLKTISTGGLSFPGYMYGGTLPRHLRGVITITDLTRDENSWKTIAHELGHKLLNVSHEHRETSPQHEVRAEGGLMFYGSGIEIPRGAEGRFHFERLHRSPYLYVKNDDGTTVWNRDYAAAGFYYDPVYEGVSVEFGPGSD